MEKPNILLISSDHHRGDCLSISGHPAVMTPQIDQLAFEGVRFERAYSTCPTCIPARQMIMTGRDSYSFGVHKYIEKTVIPSGIPTMQELITKAGYQTQAIGKMHLFPQRARYGFENIIICEEGRRLDGLKRDDYEWELEDKGYRGMIWAHGLAHNQAAARIWHLPEELHSTNWVAREGCRFFERKDPIKPFFLWLSFPKPHPPYAPPLAYWEMYRDRKLPEPALGKWLAKGPIPTCLLDSMKTRNVDLVDSTERKAVMRAYYALITQIDNQIGFVLGDLRERGLLENTFIVYLSDHGDLMWDHRAMYKAAFYEGAARVPLIIRPHRDFDWDKYGWKPGAVFYNPVALYDIMPTLLKIAGAEIPDGIEAVSLFSEKKRDFVFGDYDGDHFLTDGRYKYLWHRAGGIEQLFDLKNDPKEEENLAEKQDVDKWRERLIAYLTDKEKTLPQNRNESVMSMYNKNTVVKDGRLVPIPHPGNSFTRELNEWHNRGAHF
ncbi:MAG: sulfatase-like hydrolase/transferase [Spirochaetales bacterium]|nr:sulfatase-like hydrolase/transferase [Spirochaetales bacterium]